MMKKLTIEKPRRYANIWSVYRGIKRLKSEKASKPVEIGNDQLKHLERENHANGLERRTTDTDI